MNFKEIFTHQSNNTLENYLVFDLETVPKYKSLDDVPEDEAKTFIHLAHIKHKDLYEQGMSDEQVYFQEAARYLEFNKIVCASIGRIIDNIPEIASVTLKSDSGNDKNIVLLFNTLLNNQNSLKLVGFNIVGFDIPHLGKKALRYGIVIPHQLDIWNAKPWELTSVDLFDFWKKGSLFYPNLETLAVYLKCENPKEGMHGSEVKDYYYTDQRIDLIKEYCEGDVKTTLQIFLKLYYTGIIKPQR